jgi:S-adenosylmethionine hydrolase
VKTGPESKTTRQGERPNRLPVSVSGPITLLTDFGTADYYVAAMKGVILSVNPTASIVEITHDIPPQDIEAAAFVLLSCYRDFPPGTINVAVVDPGVGSSRRPILVNAGERFFVGPDNGLFSYILEKEETSKVVHVTAEQYFRQPLSNTFHGRDVFAPVAAELSRGTSADSFGPKIDDAVRLPSLKPELTKNGKVKGRIIHIDHFGNCVTNIDRTVFADGFQLLVNGNKIKSIQASYSEAKKKGLFAIWGSAGFLEISLRNGSAAKALKARRGDEVTLSDKENHG